MVAGASFGWTGMSLIVAGTPTDRSDRLLIGGPIMMALGLLGVAFLMPVSPVAIVFTAIALVGAGIGSCWALIPPRDNSGAPTGEEDLAASSIATVQQTGFALGAALSGLAANAAGLSAGLSRTDIMSAAFWVPTSFTLAAVAALVAGVRLAALGRRSR
jgi:predicted MFS family arabinose efflux permease